MYKPYEVQLAGAPALSTCTSSSGGSSGITAWY